MKLLDREKTDFVCPICKKTSKYKITVEVNNSVLSLCPDCAVEESLKEISKIRGYRSKAYSRGMKAFIRKQIFDKIPENKKEKLIYLSLENNLQQNNILRNLAKHTKWSKYKAWNFFMNFASVYMVTPRIEKYILYFNKTRKSIIDSGEIVRLYTIANLLHILERQERSNSFFYKVARFIKLKGFISEGYYKILKKAYEENKSKIAVLQLKTGAEVIPDIAYSQGPDPEIIRKINNYFASKKNEYINVD